MHSNEKIAAIRATWLAACHRRGTPAPSSSSVVGFLSALAPADLEALDLAAEAIKYGREGGAEMALLSWAASCTKTVFVASLQVHGLSCSGAGLFSVGRTLMDQGWDMAARVAQLKINPQDIEAIASALKDVDHGEPDEVPHMTTDRTGETPAAWNKDEFDLFHAGSAPAAPKPAVSLPSASAGPADLPSDPADDGPGEARARTDTLRLKLYGKSAAHTLEIGPHRRGADFMGVHVVTIESARALPSGGYEWNRKLTLQLTPEEMPAAVAFLMNIRASVLFEHHGHERDKFLEMRWQDGGIVIVTGQRSAAYTVPVKSSAVFYVLGLFCKALQEGRQNRSTGDVLALIGCLPTA